MDNGISLDALWELGEKSISTGMIFMRSFVITSDTVTIAHVRAGEVTESGP
jgi:hypothetical protein